ARRQRRMSRTREKGRARSKPPRPPARKSEPRRPNTRGGRAGGAGQRGRAEQMGGAPQNPAYSVNIKERLDFSCAIFDGTGTLVANAPHIPVHLGSMGESVKTIIRAHGADGNARRMRPGDVYVLNAPYNGGTHLPDVTVITPVFAEDDATGRAPPLF